VLKVIKKCVGGLNWQFVAGGLAVLIALAICAKLPTLGIFAGSAPLLLLALCLIPCLLPLAWLRNAVRGKAKQAPVPENDREGYTAQK
jgi:hypothetical protein